LQLYGNIKGPRNYVKNFIKPTFHSFKYFNLYGEANKNYNLLVTGT